MISLLSDSPATSFVFSSKNTFFWLIWKALEFSKSSTYGSFLLNNPFFNSSLLCFTISSQEENKATLSILCLDISSAKHPISLHTSSTFHKRLEHNLTKSWPFYNRITFSSVPNNVFLLSVWDLAKISTNVHISSVRPKILLASIHYPVLKLPSHFKVFAIPLVPKYLC